MTVAQVSFPRLGESSTSSTEILRAFSLRRDSPRLNETSLAQNYSGSPERPFVAKILSRAPVNLA
ncbi:hypothetical protein DEO72_LG3g1335 [Vigna unguiculata]|uniref:Uncharacterized protein n=1 Tax=Vigna unguiculata TaxID=3917 RepID=A0A4D6LDY3_VIGUN|nr:hypothetical protein DEO72_LG3g1335 [Vigna unguiculata]